MRTWSVVALAVLDPVILKLLSPQNVPKCWAGTGRVAQTDSGRWGGTGTIRAARVAQGHRVAQGLSG